MPEEFLDQGNVGAGFEEVGGVAVSQSVDADFFGDAGFDHGIAEDLLHTSGGDVPAILSFEEVFGGSVLAVIGSLFSKDGLGKIDVAVFFAFGALNEDGVGDRIDITDAEVYDFADAKPHAITEMENELVLGIVYSGEEFLYFFGIECFGQEYRFFGPGDIEEDFLLIKNFFEIEFHGVHSAVNLIF